MVIGFFAQFYTSQEAPGLPDIPSFCPNFKKLGGTMAFC